MGSEEKTGGSEQTNLGVYFSARFCAYLCNTAASDGQMTTMSTGGPVKLSGTKIKQIGSSTLWSGSGEVGPLQKIEKEIESLSSELKNAGIDKLRTTLIKKVIFPIRKDDLERHKALYGRETLERKTPHTDLLFADYKNGAPKILHIKPDVNDEELQEFGFGATGIGNTFAYTILKNYDVKNLSIDERKALAYLVIKDAIETGAFGLGEPISIWTITQIEEQEKKIIRSREVPKEEMDAIKDTYFSLKEAEVETFKKIVKK